LEETLFFIYYRTGRLDTLFYYHRHWSARSLRSAGLFELEG